MTLAGGCALMTSCEAVAGTTSKLDEVAVVMPPPENSSENRIPALSIDKLEKIATLSWMGSVKVPFRTALLGPFESEIVTVPVVPVRS